jgi:hypothetical protein
MHLTFFFSFFFFPSITNFFYTIYLLGKISTIALNLIYITEKKILIADFMTKGLSTKQYKDYEYCYYFFWFNFKISLFLYELVRFGIYFLAFMI